MLIGTRTRVNAPGLTGRLSREITTQAQVLAPLWDGTHAIGTATPATAGHRLLASAAASGEDVELAAAWVSA